MDVDETLLKLGKFNKRRIATYCMVCCSVNIAACWHMMAIVFIGKLPFIISITVIPGWTAVQRHVLGINCSLVCQL